MRCYSSNLNHTRLRKFRVKSFHSNFNFVSLNICITIGFSFLSLHYSHPHCLVFPCGYALDPIYHLQKILKRLPPLWKVVQVCWSLVVLETLMQAIFKYSGYREVKADIGLARWCRGENTLKEIQVIYSQLLHTVSHETAKTPLHQHWGACSTSSPLVFQCGRNRKISFIGARERKKYHRLLSSLLFCLQT